MAQLSVVLIGLIGSGKTSIYNCITNSKERSQSGGKQCTQKVFLKQSQFGRIPIKVFDTPGLGDYKTKMNSAAGIIAAFNEGPLNRIMVVVRFERVDIMVQAFAHSIAFLSRYKDLVTLLVTHWDLQSGSEEESNKKIIKDRFEKFNIKSFIFSSKNESGEKLCDQILQELKNTEAIQVELLTSDYNQFDLAEFQDDIELEIELSKCNLSENFKKQMRGIRKFIEKCPTTSPQFNDIMHVLCLTKGFSQILKISCNS